jgi:hypothetical protein
MGLHDLLQGYLSVFAVNEVQEGNELLNGAGSMSVNFYFG